MKDMRVEFEAWYNQFGSRFVSDTFKLDADGDYEFEGIQSSWEAWQAALSAVPAQEPLQKQLEEITRRHDQQVRINKRLIKAWKDAQQPAQEPQVASTTTSKINNLGQENSCLVATCNVQDESCELCMSGGGKCLKQSAQQPVAYRVIASTNGEVVRDSLEFTRMSEIDEKVVRKSYELQIIPLYVPEIYSRSSLEQFDLDQSKEYNVGRKDGRVIGYEVGYRHATESSQAQQPAQEPVGEVQHYAAPANLPAYVNMKWYGKPPKNGTKLYTAPVKQESKP